MIKQVRLPAPYVSSLAAAITLAMACGDAQAFRFDTGNSDVKMRWDNTLKYSTIYRLNDPDEDHLARYIGSPAGDGDRNFNKGIASNRFDLLSEFDLIHGGNKGIRVSATGWYDSVYNKSNDNDTGLTHNLSADADEFNSETEEAVGKDLKLLDAFGFYKGYAGERPFSVRLGQHTVIYGETLMSGANGIAAAQGPVDIVKAATVPGAQVKEFLLPTNQISATYQPTDAISLGAYYQFEWEKSDFFPAGSFLSPNDILGPGAESFLDTLPVPRTDDLDARDSGQWGMQLRYRPESMDVEWGFYAANYHDKTPSAVYVNIGQNAFLSSIGLTPPDNIAPASFTRVYHEDIRTYGISASTLLGDDNVSIEASIRENMPLTGGLCPATDPAGCGYFINTTSLLGGPSFDNKDNPGYAVGKTQHITLVDIHIFQPNAILKDGGSVATQLDWHRVSSVTDNEEMIDQTTTKSASSVTVAFTADYYQVLEGIDISIPIVWTHNLTGRSRAYVGWIEHGGSLDVGLNFTYHTVWKGGFNYHQFQGHEGSGIGAGSFDQTQFDRDYLSFNISRTF
jgi:hypothetical protein